MRVSLGVSLFVVLSGIALFGVGLARMDTYYIASGIPIFLLGVFFAAIVLGKCVGEGVAEDAIVLEGRTPTSAPTLSTNPVMKKNKSDTDLELMGHMDDEGTV